MLIVEEFGKQKKNYDLSLIIPVYNVETYVEQSLSSVLTQNKLDIQLIIVNDGSTDNSLEVVRNYIKRNNNLLSGMLISQENLGLSSARNRGMGYAIGKYVAFLDSDDFAAPMAYSQAVRYAEAENCEVVFSRALAFDDKTLATYPFSDAEFWEQILQGRSCLAKLNYRSTPQLFALEASSCVGILSREFIGRINLQFPVGQQYEDVYPHILIIEQAHTVGLLNNTLLYYRTNRPGKITEERSEHIFDMIDAVSAITEDESVLNLGPHVGIYIVHLLIRMSFWCGRRILGSDREKFFFLLIDKFGKLPEDWLRNFQRYSQFDYKYRYVVNLIVKKKNRLLCKLAVRTPNKFSIAMFLLTQKEYDLFTKLTMKALGKM